MCKSVQHCIRGAIINLQTSSFRYARGLIMPPKEKDLFSRVVFIRTFIMLLGPLFVLGAGIFGYMFYNADPEETRHVSMYIVVGLLCVVGLAALGGFMAIFLINASGSGFVNMFMGIRSIRSLREQYSGDLERIKFYIRKDMYVDALILVEEILEKEPDFIEVLAFKAQIQWEGSQDSAGAWKTLRKILSATQRDDPHHRWAKEYFKQVTGNIPRE